jgi:hypothetical protein
MHLRRLSKDKITVHGFTSSFRDWASEATIFPHEVCEAALAHAIKSKTESAYRRGDMLAKRAKLMNAWADYCEPKATGKVIPLTKRQSGDPKHGDRFATDKADDAPPAFSVPPRKGAKKGRAIGSR